MKKVLVGLSLLLFTTGTFAQNIDKVFKKYKAKSNVQYVTLDKEMLKSAQADQIDAIQVLNFEDCDQQLIDEFSKEIKKYKFKKYETLIKVDEEGEYTHILVSPKGDSLGEMIVIHIEEDEASLVQLKGNLKEANGMKGLSKMKGIEGIDL